VKANILCEIWVKMMNIYTKELSYLAEMASIQKDLYLENGSIIITIQSFSDSLENFCI